MCYYLLSPFHSFNTSKVQEIILLLCFLTLFNITQSSIEGIIWIKFLWVLYKDNFVMNMYWWFGSCFAKKSKIETVSSAVNKTKLMLLAANSGDQLLRNTEYRVSGLKLYVCEWLLGTQNKGSHVLISLSIIVSFMCSLCSEAKDENHRYWERVHVVYQFINNDWTSLHIKIDSMLYMLAVCCFVVVRLGLLKICQESKTWWQE